MNLKEEDEFSSEFAFEDGLIIVGVFCVFLCLLAFLFLLFPPLGKLFK